MNPAIIASLVAAGCSILASFGVAVIMADVKDIRYRVGRLESKAMGGKS